jgi:hypothetical protein
VYFNVTYSELSLLQTHTYIHIHICMRARTCLNTCTGIFIYMRMYMYRYFYTFSHMCIIHVCTHAHSHTYMHTLYIHTYIYMAYRHTYMHANTYTYMHTCMHAYITYTILFRCCESAKQDSTHRGRNTCTSEVLRSTENSSLHNNLINRFETDRIVYFKLFFFVFWLSGMSQGV